MFNQTSILIIRLVNVITHYVIKINKTHLWEKSARIPSPVPLATLTLILPRLRNLTILQSAISGSSVQFEALHWNNMKVCCDTDEESPRRDYILCIQLATVNFPVWPWVQKLVILTIWVIFKIWINIYNFPPYSPSEISHELYLSRCVLEITEIYLINQVFYNSDYELTHCPEKQTYILCTS